MTLYLVDGHALAFRSYYAFINNPLVNSKGEETSAVFGFLNTLFSLISNEKPEYLAVVFDTKAKTFRHERYPEYKANRAEMPDSLAQQLPVIYGALDAMNIAQYSMDGYEADDLLATISHQLKNDVSVKVVSGDKDLLQLVDDRVHVIRPGKTNVVETEIDPEGLIEFMGIRPEQMVDYLALVGDTSDNVPGVRGIGQKTALTLLNEYSSLDALYDDIEAVEPPSIRRRLVEGRESAMMSRELVMLKDDVPLTVSLEEMMRGEMRTDALRELLKDLEFERLTKEVFGTEASGAIAAPVDGAAEAGGDTRSPEPPNNQEGEPVYTLVNTQGGLKKLVRKLESAAEFAVDVETSGLDPMRAVLAGVAIATAPTEAYYIPVASELGDTGLGLVPAETAPGLELEVVRDALAPTFADDCVAKIGQNIKYDAIVLERAGMPLAGINFDTMIASYCLDPARRSHSLDALSREFCGHEMIPFKSLFDTRSRDKDIRQVSLDRVTEYACEDADYTYRLKFVFEPMLNASQVLSLFRDVEMPLEEVLTRMETTGVKVDVDFLGALSSQYAGKIGKLEERIFTSVGERFNINSTQQLRHVLFDRLGLKPARKTKTGYSTDGDVLTSLADQHEVPRLLLDYRQLIKLKNTYIDAIPKLVHPDTGRVHTSYNQAVASTGRLSSSDPNLQNIPIRTAEGREIRKAFVASDADSVLLDADYSQIELRILAHLSGDAGLIAAFRDDADIHRLTAAKILGVPPADVSDEMRSRAKTVNFGIVYGMGARGLAQSLEIELTEARQFIDDYFRTYPGVKRYIDETIERARANKAVDTMLGRVRQLHDIDSSNGRARAFSERIAVNTPVQGTAADIIKLAMLDVDQVIRERGLRSRMILQVHDELLFDVPSEELEEMKGIVEHSMETAIALEVPLKVDMGFGANWLEAH